MPILYAYKNCDTCRKAAKWLAQRHIPVEIRPIRETPPTPDELKAALAALGGDIRKLFNTSGTDYRQLGLKDKLPSMSEADALRLLSQNGNLVKRPLLIGDRAILAGFHEPTWAAALG